MDTKNIGFNLEKELAEQSDQDLQLGASDVPVGVSNEVDGLVVAGYAWPAPVNGIYPRVLNQINHAFTLVSEFAKQWLPTGQIQRGIQDFMNCATNAPVNRYENKFIYGLETNVFDKELVDWWKKVGYINPKNGKFEASNAFNSILSGTTRQGNSLKAPFQSITNHGLIPLSMLPDDRSMNWEQYHNPNRITQAMRDLGKEFLRRLNPENPERALMYVQVPYRDFPKVTKGLKWDAFDSYDDPVDGDFIKRLAVDYNFLNYGYKTIINYVPKKKEEQEKNDMPKLYKAKDKPEIYQLGLGDQLYHHIIDEPVFKGLYGDFSSVEIVELPQIPEEQIGFTIYNKSSLIGLILNLFKGLKGKQ